MIIQTGSRTDIPAFYAPWFANRLRAGFVMVRSPYDLQTVTRYVLSTDVVDVIGFCTKNPRPMLAYMDLLRPYGQFWHVTITPYGPDIEPRVPDKAQVMEDFRRISDLVGPDATAWRFDPIFISDRYTVDRHIEAFEAMARRLEGATHTAVISFIDLYEKTRRNFPEARPVNREERHALGRAMADIARAHGMVLTPCCEGDELAVYGSNCSGCMTIPMYEKAIGKRLKVPPHGPSRKECACYLGGDIGAYNTCGHLCRYCYANVSAEAVRANMQAHDPESPLLVGNLMPGDRVREARQESWIDNQLRMDFD